jgi:hypothetical protein
MLINNPKIGVFMEKNQLTTTVRLMMTEPAKESDLTYKDRDGNVKARVRESLEAYLLGTGNPTTKIDININKFVGGNQYRSVKITDLFKTFIKHEGELKTGKKVLLAHLELIPQKNNFSESGVINAFQPYLVGYDVADASESDQLEISTIFSFYGEPVSANN